MLGGTLQQAVAIAQRRPHPFCEEVQEGSPTQESLIGWHKCHITNVIADISLVNGGAVLGEISANSPITREMVWNILPFTDNTVAYIQLRGGDIANVLENAIAFVTSESPLNPYLQGAYPYASGLKFDVDLTSKDKKVSNVQVLVGNTGEYAPIELSSSYWMVTNNWIAGNGDGYLDGITPLQVVSTKLGYTREFEEFLTALEGRWEPPTIDEMSTVSFNATGLPVSINATPSEAEELPES